MAFTGLSGANPYLRGNVIDISSKPTNLAIQLAQREQAKTDALEKYFLEYDKNINPAGMRNNDIDDLLKMKTSAKQFYFQNKSAINNPEIDGGKALTAFMNENQRMLGHVSQSKQEAANGLVLGKAVYDAKIKNKIVDDETFNAIKSSEQPLLSKGRKPFDISGFNAYDPHDPLKYSKDIYTRIPLSESIPVVKSLPGKKNWVYTETKSAIDPNNLGLIESEVRGQLQKDKGLNKFINELSKDQKEVGRLAGEYKRYYGKEMPMTAPDLAVAYTLSLAPEKTIASGEREDPAFARSQQNAYIEGRKDDSRTLNANNAVNKFYKSGKDISLTTNNGKTPLISGRQVTFPSEIEDIVFDKKKGVVLRPNYTIMSHDKKKLDLIYLDAKNHVNESKTRTLDVEADLVPSIGKAYGGLKWTRENLFEGETPETSTPPAPAQPGTAKAKGKIDLKAFDKTKNK
jgi:hypothetical protein